MTLEINSSWQLLYVNPKVISPTLTLVSTVFSLHQLLSKDFQRPLNKRDLCFWLQTEQIL